MVEAVLKEIAKSSRGMEASQRQFREAANENNRSITKVVKDLASSFASQKKQNVDLANSISESIAQSQQTASKVDSTNGLLQESITLQSQMLGELKNIRISIKSLADSISQSGAGSNSGGAGGATGKIGGPVGAYMAAAAGAGALLGGAAGITLAGGGQNGATGGAGGTNATPAGGDMSGGGLKPANISGNASEAMQFFQSKGWTKEQAAGIVGNLQVESGNFSPAVLSGQKRGDGGKAVGVAQWHPDRQAKFQQVMGKPLVGAPFKDQLEFIHWELNNTEKKAGNLLRSATSAAQAAEIVDKYYERSSGAHRQQRISNANNLAGSQSNQQTNTNAAQISGGNQQQGDNAQNQTAGAAAASPQQPSADTATGITPSAGAGAGAAAGASASGSPASDATAVPSAAGSKESEPDATPSAGAGSAGGTGGGNVRQAQSGIRKLPISDKLMGVLQQAAKSAGVDVTVTSGGQPAYPKGPRTGSTRHDLGNAADLDLYMGGRILSDANPKDIEIKKKFVSAATAAGATGIGAGYMGPTKIHVGFGTPAKWGGASWLSGITPGSGKGSDATPSGGAAGGAATGGTEAAGATGAAGGAGGMGMGGMMNPLAMMGMMGGGKFGAMAGALGLLAPLMGGMIGGSASAGATASGATAGGSTSSSTPERAEPQQAAAGESLTGWKKLAQISPDQQTSADFFRADAEESQRQKLKTSTIQKTAVERTAGEQLAQERLASPPTPPERPEGLGAQQSAPSQAVNSGGAGNDDVEKWSWHTQLKDAYGPIFSQIMSA